MKDLLVTIAHHSAPGRLQYLRRMLEEFAKYELTNDVLIDTDVAGLDVHGDNITTVHHPSLAHPFHLTWIHRQHMKAELENYRYLAYFEDDILLPWENFDHYRERFFLLWPDYVPGFVRVETYNGEQFAVDATERTPIQCVRDYHCALRQSYHGFWIMPQEALKATMKPDFVRVSDSREAAASYPMADLNKAVLVEVEAGGVSKKSLAYHLSNSYAPCATSPHGKISVADIFL